MVPARRTAGFRKVRPRAIRVNEREALRLWQPPGPPHSIGCMPVNPAQLRIVRYPDPVLKRKTAPVERIDDEVRAVAARMIELMHEVNGLGLAAPQVGLSWRMFVVAGAAWDQPDAPDQTFINPAIRFTDRSMEQHEEGCLSLPGIHVDVRRPVGVELRATTLDGDEVVMQSSDFIARVWQHEFDHLDGVLIIDRATPMARLATRRALKELRAEHG